jgi:hypothetical protein
MLLRQLLKTGTHVLELVNFMQDRLKRHAYTDFPLQCQCQCLRRGELQMDWLRSEDLKEEKVVTTSLLSVPACEGLR